MTSLRRRPWIWIFGGMLLLLLLLPVVAYTLGGYLLLPNIAKQQLTKFVADNLGRQLHVQQIQFNPFELSLVLNGVELREADGTLLLSFQTLTADVAVKKLFDRQLVFDDIGLQGIWLHLQIDKQGSSNFSRLLGDIMAMREEGASNRDSRPMGCR